DPSGNFVFDQGLQGPPTHLAVVGVDSPAPPPADSGDYYSFTLAKGQSATLALTDLAGQADLQLQDSSGTPLSLAATGKTGVSESINNFIAPAAGTYYAHITGLGVRYSLVVTKSSDFDTGSSQSSPQVFEGDKRVLGYAGISSLLLQPGGPKVLYFADFNLGTDTFGQALTNLGVSATVASSYGDFENKLTSQSWDLVILANQDFFDSSWVAPLVSYVNAGGRAILDSWIQDNTAAAAFGAMYSGNNNGNSIIQTVADPIWNGISNP